MLEEDPTQFSNTQAKQFPQKLIPLTADHRHFQKYQTKQTLSLSQAPLVKFYDSTFLYTDADTLYLQRPGKSLYNLTKVHQISSVDFKNQGLMGIGQKTGYFNLVEIDQKRVIRSLSVFPTPISCLTFDQDSVVLGGSSLKVVDFIENEILRNYDIGRPLSLESLGGGVLVGLEEGQVIWMDFRAKEVQGRKFRHGAGVECVKALPNGQGFVTVGGYETKLWDVRSDKALFGFESNQKTLTSCAVFSSGERVMTVSLDQHLKVYNTMDMSLTYQDKYQAPIMSLALSKDDKSFAVGQSDGTMVLKKYGRSLEEQTEERPGDMIPDFLKNQEEGTRLKAYQYYNRGRNIQQQQYDIKFQHKKQKLAAHDKCLKKFQYKAGLISVIGTKQTDLIISYIEELMQRDALDIALGKLDQNELKIVLSFIARKIKNANCNEVLLKCLQIIEEHYNNSENHELFQEIDQVIKQELELESQMLEMQGLLETLMNCHQLNV